MEVDEKKTQSGAVVVNIDSDKSKAQLKRGGNFTNGCLGCLFLIAAWFSFITIGLLSLAVIVLIWNSDKISKIGDEDSQKFSYNYLSGGKDAEKKIAVLNVDGIIMPYSAKSPFSEKYETSADRFCEMVDFIKKDKAIRACIVRINSPGGEVTAADRMYNAIKRLREEREMVVVACLESQATSGGYYVASACDAIISSRMCLTGSVGVIIQNYKYYDLFKKIGLKGETYKSGQFKDILNGDRKTTAAEKAIIDAMIKKIFDNFIDVVDAGRKKMNREQVMAAVGDARILLGEEALKLGLVDKLGYFEDAVAYTAESADLKSNFKIVSVRRKSSFFELFAETKSGFSVELPASVKTSLELEPGHVYLLPIR